MEIIFLAIGDFVIIKLATEYFLLSGSIDAEPRHLLRVAFASIFIFVQLAWFSWAIWITDGREMALGIGALAVVSILVSIVIIGLAWRRWNRSRKHWGSSIKGGCQETKTP